MSVGPRFVSRFDPGRKALLEEHVNPLYHRRTFAAAGLEELFFFVGVDPADNSALAISPQIKGSGQLPNPKMYAVQGHRQVYSEDVTVQADRVEDLIVLLYNTFDRFFQGEKTYWTAPSFYFPSGGLGVNAFFDIDGSAGPVERAVAHSGGGGFFDRFSTKRIPIVIAPVQAFDGLIAPPAGSTAEINSDRDVWYILDGAMGREIQRADIREWNRDGWEGLKV